MCNHKIVINIMLWLLNTTVVDPRFQPRRTQYSLKSIFFVYQTENVRKYLNNIVKNSRLVFPTTKCYANVIIAISTSTPMVTQ